MAGGKMRMYKASKSSKQKVTKGQVDKAINKALNKVVEHKYYDIQ